MSHSDPQLRTRRTLLYSWVWLGASEGWWGYWGVGESMEQERARGRREEGGSYKEVNLLDEPAEAPRDDAAGSVLQCSP